MTGEVHVVEDHPDMTAEEEAETRGNRLIQMMSATSVVGRATMLMTVEKVVAEAVAVAGKMPLTSISCHNVTAFKYFSLPV